jgi:DNA-binding NtrC family response regulator
MQKEKTIAVVAADLQEQQELCRVLERNRYRTVRFQKDSGLVNRIRESSCDALILDLDSTSVDNRFIRSLSRENPQLYIIGISSRTFHPELEESMRAHISACLSKPVDEDELLFWLKSISAGELRSRASP